MPKRTSSSSRHRKSRSGSGAGANAVTRAVTRARVRIIGGLWRGRWIHFTEAEGLRPTGDRMRETLFNWLQGSVHGARCLDLFAGTGVLGLEAVSRGAAMTVLVDANPVVCEQLEAEVSTLAANDPALAQRLPIQSVTAETYLQREATGNDQFDIVFVDPPFSEDIQIDILSLLLRSGQLAEPALVYVEGPVSAALETRLPAGYVVHRAKKQGNVQCLLLQYVAPVD